MITTNTTKLLMEAPRLIKIGVQRGWLSYPKDMAFKEDGTLDPVMQDEPEVTEQRHTPDLARKAYDLRERDLSLDDVAKACGVARGSVAYIIAKGHEMYLKQQRIDHNTTQATNLLPKA